MVAEEQSASHGHDVMAVVVAVVRVMVILGHIPFGHPLVPGLIINLFDDFPHFILMS